MRGRKELSPSAHRLGMTSWTGVLVFGTSLLLAGKGSIPPLPQTGILFSSCHHILHTCPSDIVCVSVVAVIYHRHSSHPHCDFCTLPVCTCIYPTLALPPSSCPCITCLAPYRPHITHPTRLLLLFSAFCSYIVFALCPGSGR